MSQRRSSRTYLSLLLRPEPFNHAALARLIADASGLDIATLALALRRPPPALLGRCPAAVAARATAMIDAAGGVAFAPTAEDLEAIGPACPLRDLAVREGAIEVLAFGRDARPEAIPLDAIETLVRAGIAAVRAELIDIHLADGRLLRIDGRRFGFRALGAMRGHGDAPNADALLDLLAHLAPAATVDVYFPLFRRGPAPERLRVVAPGDDPRFGFYTRWIALGYRRLLRDARRVE